VTDEHDRPLDRGHDTSDVCGVEATPRSGRAGASTGCPVRCRCLMTPFQLDASANAP
jgi:hypothetical protein